MTTQPIKFHPRQPTERIKRVHEVKDILFSELNVLNVILTNACNLSCSYCFEQHKKDYGKFTIEQLKQVYDFFLTANDMEHRNFQFFGGEPLAQKAKILEFCRTFKDELTANKEKVRVSIVTNALLLTPEFMEEYCGYDFTSMVISLDTDDVATNRRELTQENIDYIFKMIEMLPDKMMRDRHHSVIRCTINEESVPYLRRFIERLYTSGVRNFIIHPLIMGREQGVIEWQPGVWEDMHQTIRWAMRTYRDFKITWAEGVGVKGESNCMVGSGMIAMDASGDFSGCYFFTNLKDQAGHTILGNLFRDEIYIDRYVNFQKAYMDALEHEQCKSCNLKDFCYQCPAGNSATGGTLFRPDSMCKRIVELFLELREDGNRHAVMKKYYDITDAVNDGDTDAPARAIVHFMYHTLRGEKLNNDAIKHYKLPSAAEMMATYHLMLTEPGAFDLPDVDTFLTHIDDYRMSTMEAYEFYRFLCQYNKVPTDFSYKPEYTAQEERYFIAMMHLLTFNNIAYLNKFKEERSRVRILDL